MIFIMEKMFKQGKIMSKNCGLRISDLKSEFDFNNRGLGEAKAQVKVEMEAIPCHIDA